MNDTNNLTAAPKMFTRFCTNQFVKDHVREAKRRGYSVTKDDFSDITIMDGTNIVMSGLKFNRDGWMIRFSSLYWQDNSIA